MNAFCARFRLCDKKEPPNLQTKVKSEELNSTLCPERHKRDEFGRLKLLPQTSLLPPVVIAVDISIYGGQRPSVMM